jgi:hypothetical protein
VLPTPRSPTTRRTVLWQQPVYRKSTPARKRMLLTLKEAEERFAHELLDEEERLVLHDRIIRLKKKLASLAVS